MASVNEGFVEDEDLKEVKEKHDKESKSTKEPVEDIFDVKIDYSKARKAPIIIATISGNN